MSNLRSLIFFLILAALALAVVVTSSPMQRHNDWPDFWIAVGTVFLACGTTALAWYTLGLWRETQNVAKEAKETTRRELRAYVNVKDCGASKSGFGTVVEVTFENTGKTPACSVQCKVNWGWYDPAIPDDFDFADHGLLAGSESLEPSRMVLGPGQGSQMVVGETFNDEAIQRLARRVQGRLFAWGWIEYDDVYSPITPRRRTEFCYELVGFEELPTLSIRCRNRSNFNSTDEDCLRPTATTGRSKAAL